MPESAVSGRKCSFLGHKLLTGFTQETKKICDGRCMHNFRILLLLSLLSQFALAQLPPKTTLAGLVTSPVQGKGVGAVEGVTVKIIGTDKEAKTNKNGLFVFSNPPAGELTLLVSKSGYQSQNRTVSVERDSLSPTVLSVQLLPEGVSFEDGRLSGAGTVYVAYAERRRDKSAPVGRPRWNDIDRRGEWLHSDPLENVTQDGPTWNDRPNTPFNLSPNSVMLYPPSVPHRSTYLQTKGPVYHIALGGDKRHLFAAGSEPSILVFDEEQKHEKAAFIPLPHGGRVTRMCRSKNGRQILATVMSGVSGILIVDSERLQMETYLPLDYTSPFTPSALAEGPNDSILVALSKQHLPGLLLVMDRSTGMVRNEIQVGVNPATVVTSPDGRFAYVTNSGSGNLSVIDLTQGKSAGILPLGVTPRGCAVTPDGKSLVVANEGSDTLSVVSLAEHRLRAHIRVGKGPLALVVTPDSKTCYVANRNSGTISTVDLESLEEKHRTTPTLRAQAMGILLRE